MKAETLLAFDFGEKRIGIAVGNDFLGQAQALKTLQAETTEARFTQIAALIAEWQPQRLVVGMPFNADSESAKSSVTAQRCERFANQLQGRFGLPVILVDERYSSLEADDLQRTRRQQGLAGRKHINDDLAAQIILQRYFDAHELRT